MYKTEEGRTCCVCACTCECVCKGGYEEELAGPRASREQGASPPLTEQTHNTPHPIPALRPGEPQHRLGAWRKGKPTWPMGPGARAIVCLMEVPKHGRSVQRGWNWGWGGQGGV